MGHAVSCAPASRRRYDVIAAKNGSDFEELAERPAPDRRIERLPGSGPLLRYLPFEGPLYQGINHYH
jgi:hypothetical protein